MLFNKFSYFYLMLKPSQQRPTPLLSSEVDEYLLALSQEYRGSIRDSPFYLKPKTVKRGIHRLLFFNSGCHIYTVQDSTLNNFSLF